eukprot:754805-Hanusia_phi.AAC.2
MSAALHCVLLVLVLITMAFALSSHMSTGRQVVAEHGAIPHFIRALQSPVGDGPLAAIAGALRNLVRTQLCLAATSELEMLFVCLRLGGTTADPASWRCGAAGGSVQAGQGGGSERRREVKVSMQKRGRRRRSEMAEEEIVEEGVVEVGRLEIKVKGRRVAMSLASRSLRTFLMQSDAVLACAAAALGNLADDDENRVVIAK